MPAPHGTCPLCGRTGRLTLHHLIPKKLHRRAAFRNHHDRETLRRGIAICRPCHDGIHARYDEMTLARDFASLDALRHDPDLARHFAWVARQKATF